MWKRGRFSKSASFSVYGEGSILEDAIRKAIQCTGCCESIVINLFNYFKEHKDANVFGMLNDASIEFNMSPIVIISAYNIWVNA